MSSHRSLQVPHIVLLLAKYPRNSKLFGIISNPANGQVLLLRQLVNQTNNKNQGWLPVSKWQDAGLEEIAEEITCHPLRSDFFTDKLLLALPDPEARP